MTAQAMVNLLVYFLLALWGTSVILLVLAMVGHEMPPITFKPSRRSTPTERSLKLVHYRPGLARAPVRAVRPARGPHRASSAQPAAMRPRPRHLRVVGL